MSLAVYNSFRLVFGTLYPAYASYKAVKTKNVKEYVSFYFNFSKKNYHIPPKKPQSTMSACQINILQLFFFVDPTSSASVDL